MCESDVDVVHALYQTGPPCNCDLRSICNLTTPGGRAASDIQYSTVAACHLSIHILNRTNQTLYITALGGRWDWSCSELRAENKISTSTVTLFDNDRGLYPVAYKLSRHGILEVFPHIDNNCVMHKHASKANLHVGVSSGGEPLSGQTDDVQTRRQLVEESWVT